MDPKNFNYVLLVTIIAGFGITLGLQGYQIVTITGGAGGQQTVTLDIEGSTTCEPIISAAAVEYMNINRDWYIYVSGTGSGDGIAAVESENADIGMASRNLKASENATGKLIDHEFAFDGIAVVVGSGVSFENDNFINFSTIVGIYNQTWTDWGNVPGCTASGTINVYVRGSESGTRSTFESITGLATADNWPNAATSHTEVASNGDMQSNIQSDTLGIGYVGLGFMSGVQELRVSPDTPGNAYYPTTTTVSEGNYPISRSLHLFTSGSATGATKAFLDFIYSPMGQEIVAEQDFVSIYNGTLFR